jgi:hypothetical protein
MLASIKTLILLVLSTQVAGVLEKLDESRIKK